MSARLLVPVCARAVARLLLGCVVLQVGGCAAPPTGSPSGGGADGAAPLPATLVHPDGAVDAAIGSLADTEPVAQKPAAEAPAPDLGRLRSTLGNTPAAAPAARRMLPAPAPRPPSPQPSAAPRAPLASANVEVDGRVLQIDGREQAPGFQDPANPAADLLQQPAEALGGFPRDRLGNVDWVATLASGMIAPRERRSGRGAPRRKLATDVLLTDTREMPHVRFPHRQHSEWLDCSNCHPAPFVAESGANPISMNDIFAGRYCGVCHDRVAFSTFACERCHSVPHANSVKPWW